MCSRAFDLSVFPSMSRHPAAPFTRCYPCSFTFYLGNPFPRFLRSYWKEGPRSLNVGTMKLEREDILARLRAGLPALKRQFPLHGLSLFGSVVRGEALAESDIDVIADVEPSIGLDFVTLADKLEELTGHKIDLVSRRAIKPLLWKQIERELIDV